MIITIFVLLFLYLPIIIMAINSFNESRFGGVWTGFSLKWYQGLLKEKAIWRALKNSLIIGFSATFLSATLGTLGAFAIHRFKTPLQKIHYGLQFAPLVFQTF